MDKNLLKDVSRVLVHGHCPDGMASAYILHQALGIEPEFLIHGTQEYLSLKPSPGMLFCDIAPPKDKANEFKEAGAIVLDHHKGSEDLVKSFVDRGVFADEDLEPGVSGATLAYREVWSSLRPSTMAPMSRRANSNLARMSELIGITDTWQSQHPLWETARHMTCAFSFYPWDYWKERNKITSFNKELETGKMIFNNRQDQAKKCSKEIYSFNHDKYKVAVFNDVSYLTSDVAEILRCKGYNVIAGFKYSLEKSNAKSLIFSLRSDSSIDVRDLAQFAEDDGGGHTKAAGFTSCNNGKDPFDFFKELFESYIFVKGDYL